MLTRRLVLAGFRAVGAARIGVSMLAVVVIVISAIRGGLVLLMVMA